MSSKEVKLKKADSKAVKEVAKFLKDREKRIEKAYGARHSES